MADHTTSLTESASLNSGEFLNTVLNTVLDGILTIDRQGVIRIANAAAEQTFGYSAEELIGQNVSLLMPQPDAGRHDAYMQQYLQGGQARVIGIGREVVGLRKNGERFPLELSVSECRIDGEPFFVGLTRDISERKKALEQLNLQGAALDAAANAVLITDRDGAILWVNHAFTRLTGYLEDEVIGKSTRIFKSGEMDSGFFKDLWETVLAGKVWRGEIVNRRKDGSTYCEEQTITPVRDKQGEISHFVAIKQDITARKQSERELEEKNREIQASALFDRTHGDIMELFSSHNDQHTILQHALVALAETHGILASAVYLYDEWSGTLRCTASFGAPAELAMECRPGEGLIGQAAKDRKLHILQASGDMPLRIETGLFPVTPEAVAASPILYQGKVMGVLVAAMVTAPSARDLSFLERLSGQMGVGLNNIKQFHDLKALSDQLKQRGREIARKNSQLEDANRLKSEFLANMSHELRTPLNAIIGFSEVLKDGLLGELSEEQVDYIKDIFDSANHLLSLINDILDLSKIEAGKMDLDLSEVNLKEMLSNSLSIVKEKAHANNIQLHRDIADEVETIQADPRKLKQVLYNLLSNAVKFTPKGGKVRLVARREDTHLVVSVIDTGIGIPQEKIPRLFRHFEQLDGSLSRKHEGTGLGLVMVKHLVELHGGSVEVESTPDVGSTFTVRIPYNTPARAAAEPPALQPAAEKEARPPLVMVVEPNEASAQAILKHLNTAGYRAEWARNGSETMEKIGQSSPDLIVLDIHFSQSDDWQVLTRLHGTEGKLADIPVMLISMLDHDKGLSFGKVSLLEKPLHKDTLLETLKRLTPPEDRLEPPHVLVVDDDANALEYVSAHLEGEGYRTIRAEDGHTAIELAEQELPDLLILDLMMPEVTGFDVVAALRANSATENIPIVILTAKVLDEEDRQLLEGHVTQVVAKSTFDADAFMADVRAALGESDVSVPGGVRKTPHVLVIEDNKDQSHLMQLYLEDAGYRVTCALNGRQGLDFLSEQKPDLITLDLLMPEMDGFAFLEEKSKQLETASIPVVVISAIADREEGAPLAADAVLSKPLRRQELLRTIGRITPADNPEHRSKVLLIDDDPKAIKIISSYLPSDSIETLAAFGGMDGLETARMELPDLILLDLMMPDFSGFEVLRELKRDERTRRIPVIILTAKILTDEERRDLQEQVELVAEKGRAGKEQIYAEVRAILGRYNQA